MIVRKNVYSLSAAEKAAFINALLELKKSGRYDHYVHVHHGVMVPTILPHEPRDANYRNGAHRGPSFLPWHRELLLQMEADLRKIDPSVSIPYWDWTKDAELGANAPIWKPDLMGGNGDERDQLRVQDGAFAHKNGKWPVPAYPGLPGPGLKRQFGKIVTTLPTADDLLLTMQERLYDTPTYDSSPFTLGFRNRLEGWVTQRGDSRVKHPGSQMHNRVHLWVGGNMVPMTSPDDPVFYLHHAFVDKVWADWQVLQKVQNPGAAPHYAPEKNGPPGHNLDDTLKPWTRTIRQTLDIKDLGYRYEGGRDREADSAPDQHEHHGQHGLAERSPFEAD